MPHGSTESEEVAPLDEWVKKECPELGEEIITTLSEVSSLGDKVRVIMTLVRERFGE